MFYVFIYYQYGESINNYKCLGHFTRIIGRNGSEMQEKYDFFLTNKTEKMQQVY
jgi:hypothetical protein